MLAAPVFLPRDQLATLFDGLRARGFAVYGPTVVNGVIALRELADTSALPTGWHDEQSPGRYRLTHDDSPRQFAWSTAPVGLKPLVQSPREILWQCQRDASGRLDFVAVEPDPPPIAVLGVRACDLTGLALQDEHFLINGELDTRYALRREALLLIAVNCSHPASTCFCASTGDGPEIRHGYDLLLDELDDGFLIRAGTPAGESLLEPLPVRAVTDEQQAQAAAQLQAASEQQTRALPGRQLTEPLWQARDSELWQQVGDDCLACGACTALCSSCFCQGVEDVGQGDGQYYRHERFWDSCFTAGHSEMGGHPLRADRAARYRQWLLHKLGFWHEQYGRSGCTGCGRCISGCPAGIDITAVAQSLCEEAS